MALGGIPQDWEQEGSNEQTAQLLNTLLNKSLQVTCSHRAQLQNSQVRQVRTQSSTLGTKDGMQASSLCSLQPSALGWPTSHPLHRGSGQAKQPCACRSLESVTRHLSFPIQSLDLQVEGVASNSRTLASLGTPFLSKMVVCNVPYLGTQNL